MLGKASLVKGWLSLWIVRWDKGTCRFVDLRDHVLREGIDRAIFIFTDDLVFLIITAKDDVASMSHLLLCCSSAHTRRLCNVEWILLSCWHVLLRSHLAMQGGSICILTECWSLHRASLQIWATSPICKTVCLSLWGLSIRSSSTMSIIFTFLGRWFWAINNIFATRYVPISNILSVSTLTVGALDSCVRLLGHLFWHFDRERMIFRIAAFLGAFHLPCNFDCLLNSVVLLTPISCLGSLWSFALTSSWAPLRLLALWSALTHRLVFKDAAPRHIDMTVSTLISS